MMSTFFIREKNERMLIYIHPLPMVRHMPFPNNNLDFRSQNGNNIL